MRPWERIGAERTEVAAARMMERLRAVARGGVLSKLLSCDWAVAG